MRVEKTLLILLLLTTFFKGIVWAAFVPIWHFPDEQAHFAQVQYYTELKKNIGAGNDLSLEVYESERLLGTLRDERGINKFTYRPEYRIPYSESYLGLHEEEIANLPEEARTSFVKKEAARYPPLFYVASSVGYLLGFPFNLFVRVFLTRIISVLMAVATVWITFLLAKTVFAKNTLLAISTATLVSFQPMYTFLSSGVNNDNLLILLSTFLLWLMVDAMRTGLTTRHTLGFGAALGLGILTKQLIYPFIPLPLFVIVYDALKKKKKRSSPLKHLLLFLFVGLVFGGVMFARHWMQTGSLPGWPRVNPESPMAHLSFITYLSEKIPQLYRETLPWYWGVFKWLGVVLPLSALRAIKVVLVLSGIGLVQYTAGKIHKRRRETRDWQLLFLAFSSIWFAAWLLVWDYTLIRSIGFSHGIQGRNFFPNIAPHMLLVVFGLWQLTTKYQRHIIKALVLAIVVLNFIALKTVLGSYYDLLPVRTFIIQASQYKPWFFKGGGLILWSVLYLTMVVNFVYSFLKLDRRKP